MRLTEIETTSQGFSQAEVFESDAISRICLVHIYQHKQYPSQQ